MIEPIFNDPQYQSLKALLDLTAARQSAIAGNVANVNTPGFHRSDVDPAFQKELERAIKAGDMEKVRNMIPKVAVDKKSPSLRMDGNNVNLEREMVELNKNNAQYEISASLISKRYKMLRMAITGRS